MPFIPRSSPPRTGSSTSGGIIGRADAAPTVFQRAATRRLAIARLNTGTKINLGGGLQDAYAGPRGSRDDALIPPPESTNGGGGTTGLSEVSSGGGGGYADTGGGSGGEAETAAESTSGVGAVVDYLKSIPLWVIVLLAVAVLAYILWRK